MAAKNGYQKFIAELNDKAGVDLRPHAEELFRWLASYLNWSENLTRPDAKRKIKYLRRLSSHGRALSKDLNVSDKALKIALDGCFEKRREPRKHFSQSITEFSAVADTEIRRLSQSISREAIVEKLTAIGCSDLVEGLDDHLKRKGRPPDVYLQIFIMMVENIYLKAGGSDKAPVWDDQHGRNRGRYQSCLLDVICHLLDLGLKYDNGGPPFSRHTVGQHLKERARRNRPA